MSFLDVLLMFLQVKLFNCSLSVYFPKFQQKTQFGNIVSPTSLLLIFFLLPEATTSSVIIKESSNLKHAAALSDLFGLQARDVLRHPAPS